MIYTSNRASSPLLAPTKAHMGVHRGNYEGPEAERLAALKWAAMLGAAYVDVELQAAKFFFGGTVLPQPSHLTCRCDIAQH